MIARAGAVVDAQPRATRGATVASAIAPAATAIARVTPTIAAAALVVGLIVATAQPAQAIDRTINVSGQCLRTVFPDRGMIVVTPDFLDKSIQTATKKATEQYEKIKKQIQDLKLKDLELQTSSYSVREEDDQVKGKTVSRGYRARMGLKVTTSEISRLGEVIAIAANNQVKDVSTFSTYLSDEKSRAEREACLEEAIQHASEKASKMAQAAHAKLGKVITLSENGGGYAGAAEPMMYEEASDASPLAKAVAAPRIDTASQKIDLSVNAVYFLE